MSMRNKSKKLCKRECAIPLNATMKVMKIKVSRYGFLRNDTCFFLYE